MKPYPSYKPSGIEWIGDIPSHWEVKRLKYVIDFITGFAFKSEKFSVENGVKLVRGINVKEGVLNWDDVRLWTELTDSLEEFYLKEDDVLIGMDGSKVGKNYCIVKHSDLPLLLVQRVARLRTHSVLNPKFLFYQIGSSRFLHYVEVQKTDPAVPHISPDDIKCYEVPLPPLPEQTTIANFLDEKTAQIDTLVANKQRLIELLKEERAAIINDAVSGEGKNWERKKLKYVVSKVGSGVTPSGGASVYQQEGIPLFRSQNIYSDRLELSDVAYITEEIDEEMSNSRIQDNDVLLNITGASIGRCFYVPKKFGRGNVNQHVCIIRPIQEKIRTRFLHAILISGYGQNLIDQCQTGANREGLNFQQIKSFELPLPDVDEQDKILNHIQTETQRIDTTITKVEKEIELLQEYRTSLISEVVTGKVKVG